MVGKRSQAAVGGRRQSRAARNEPTVRVLSMLRELDRVGGADLYELAERYGKSVRTIRRDLEAVEAAGIPVRKELSESSNRRRWVLDGSAFRHLSRGLDAEHYLALRLALDEARALRSFSALHAALEDLACRIEEAVGTRGRRQLEDIDAAFFTWDKQRWLKTPPDVLQVLVAAIAARKLCLVTFARHTSASIKLVPLRLFAHDGAVYLHAWSPKEAAGRVVCLQDLARVERLSESGSAPRTLKTELLERAAFLRDGDGPRAIHRLRFSVHVAPEVSAREWHASQSLSALPDGRLELCFECASTREVAAWVASWLSDVEVVEPASLRRQLARIGAAWARSATPSPVTLMRGRS